MVKTLTERIEEDVFQIIDDIANELNLDVPFYPEVYWLGGNLKFENLGLPEKKEELFRSIKMGNKSYYLHLDNIIFIGENNIGHMSEEAGHFLHLVNSGINLEDRSNEENFSLNSIVEMFGYFCSKLIAPNRKNVILEYPDIFENKEACIEKLAMNYVYNEGVNLEQKTYSPEMEALVKNRINMSEFAIYQQGYGLGDKLFNAYISGIIPATKIKELMKKDFAKKRSATLEFLTLKYGLLNYPNVNIT